MATDEHQLFDLEQKMALKAFLCKKDVFAVLPTGYGKSLIYQFAPLVA
jgi:ATP-dependent DNA helicase RecQ